MGFPVAGLLMGGFCVARGTNQRVGRKRNTRPSGKLRICNISNTKPAVTARQGSGQSRRQKERREGTFLGAVAGVMGD